MSHGSHNIQSFGSQDLIGSDKAGFLTRAELREAKRNKEQRSKEADRDKRQKSKKAEPVTDQLHLTNIVTGFQDDHKKEPANPVSLMELLGATLGDKIFDIFSHTNNWHDSDTGSKKKISGMKKQEFIRGMVKTAPEAFVSSILEFVGIDRRKISEIKKNLSDKVSRDGLDKLAESFTVYRDGRNYLRERLLRDLNSWLYTIHNKRQKSGNRKLEKPTALLLKWLRNNLPANQSSGSAPVPISKAT